MKKRPVHKKRSYKWFVFSAFLIFAAVLMAVIAIFQMVYLDFFYQNIKKKELRQAAAQTKELLGIEEEIGLAAKTMELMESYDLSITVIDENGCIRNAPADPPSFLGTAEVQFYLTALENETQRVEIDVVGDARDEANPFMAYESDGFLMPWQTPSGETFRPDSSEYRRFFTERREAIRTYGQSVISVERVSTEEGNRLVVVKSQISPTRTTIRTLHTQFAWIFGLTILLSLVMAVILSRHVSEPITQMNASAQKLAKRQYDVQFGEASFRELSELSETMNEAAKELGKTEKLRQELIANVSHDLRTPLTMIEAYVELMRDIPEENTPENMQVLLDETKHLTSLVNDLLDASRLQSGVVELKKTVWCLTEEVQEVTERFRKLWESEQLDISFTADQSVDVCADQAKISQVIYNFLGNAATYVGEDRKILIRQELRGEFVRISVTDHGCGIPESELPYVWERYYRSGSAHKRAARGSGLGLSIVQKILELHEASYGVDSIVGKGSTFWFELPVEKKV